MTILAVIVLLIAFVVVSNLISFGLGGDVDHWWEPPAAILLLLAFPAAMIGLAAAVIWSVKHLVGAFA